MGGFLPLVEGFLAFALTLLALTTAVSAIVGAAHRLRRRRARGLRDMVRMLYLSEVKPLLEKAEPDRSRQVSDRTAFITDMTLMPLPAVVRQMETAHEATSVWHRKLEKAEPLAGERFSIRRWRTLRYGLDALTDDEFKHRLGASAAGTELRARQAWKHSRFGSWEELEAHLLSSFHTIGAASSETFSRHSRSWSIAVGFLLAFGLNIDSFDLLNSYLTDPEVRAGVIAQSSEIVAGTTAEPAAADSVPLAEARRRLTEQAQVLLDTTEVLAGSLEQVSDLGGEQAQKLAAQLETGLGRVESGVRELGAVDQELARAEREVFGVARALTASFPIGWTRFPSCTGPDLRCAGKPSTAELSLWLTGVLVTGFLLGLGTPFWIQVVTGLLSLQRWAGKGAGRSAAENGPTPQPGSGEDEV